MIRALTIVLVIISLIGAGYYLTAGSDDTVEVDSGTAISPTFDETMGSVAVRDYSYPDITYSAAAKEGHVFLGWYDGDRVISTDAEITCPINDTRNIVAKFGLPGHTLNTLTWACPQYDDAGAVSYTSKTFDLPVSETEYNQSILSDTQRRATISSTIPSGLITFDDPYVTKVVSYLAGLTDGMTDVQKTSVILSFVQSSISYKTDIAAYGTDEFWATPYETLFSATGDCEDTAILLCSLAGAMGLDVALVAFSDHMGTAVALDGVTDAASFTTNGKTYVYCETACDTRIPIGTLSGYSIQGSTCTLIDYVDSEYVYTTISPEAAA